MAEWPTVAAVRSSLGASTGKDDVIAAATAAAIEQVATDIGYEDIDVNLDSGTDLFDATGTFDTDDSGSYESIIPNNSLSQAALILAVMAVKAPDAPYGVAAVFDLGGMRVAAQHPTYLRMLTGSRQRFGVS